MIANEKPFTLYSPGNNVVISIAGGCDGTELSVAVNMSKKITEQIIRNNSYILM